MWNRPRSATRGTRRRRRRNAKGRAARLRNLSRTPTCERLENRLLLAGDVLVRYEFTDLADNVVDSLQMGNDFLLKVHVQDARATTAGLFQAFLDVNYDAGLVSPNGSISHGAEFSAAASGDLLTAGVIDEVGAIDTDQVPPSPTSREELWFSVPFHADAMGTLVLTADLAEGPSKGIIFFDEVTKVLLENIEFVGGTIEIEAGGIRVTPTSGLSTTESGGTAGFEIVLEQAPTADVTIALASSNPQEGTVSVGSVTFTPANWSTPQTVTVTGVDDDIDDGDAVYSIVTAPAASDDALFSGVDANDVTVTNVDNDTAGIEVTPTIGLSTTEAGGTAVFQVRLTSAPLSTVTVGLSSSDLSEGTVSAPSVTFDAANWDVPQAVTVTGVDDQVDDGAVVLTIVTAAATSSDALYDGRDPEDVSVSNMDDDVAGITVAPTSGLVTSEGGAAATFDIVLNSQPIADVTIGLASNDTSEGTVSAASVTFTPANWDSAQTVTVLGVDDAVDDGDISYAVATAAAVSADVKYDGLDAPDVALANSDDDVAGIAVVPTSGLVTTEAGGTASFEVVLQSEPTADVVLAITSGDTSEGAVAPTTLTFTAVNWDVAQTVTVTGVDDLVDDDDVAYTVVTGVAISDDPAYNGLDPADASVTNSDDDVAGIAVVPTSGHVTSESGGTSTFEMVLQSEPTANVTVDLLSTDVTEGTVSIDAVTFTAANWNTPQTITVTGVDDEVDDGDVAYSIITVAAVSSDSRYSDRDAADVLVTNSDDDVAGIQVVPTSGLITDETGRTASIEVRLGTKPTADVSIPVSSSDSTEATVAPASLVFTPDSWNVVQTITVTGVDDGILDGDVDYTVILGGATSGDPSYQGLDAVDPTATNVDDDSPGITVLVPPVRETTESGGGVFVEFRVVLNTQPAADVTIGVATSDATEGLVLPTSLTFTAANWNIEQSVAVAGVDDSFDDGDVPYTVVTAPAVSDDPDYDGLNADDVSVVNLDDDTAGFVVSPADGLVTTEKGGTATFAVSLTSEPAAAVTVGLSSSDTGEGTLSADSVTFTPENWNVAQDVVVTGADDDQRDGDVKYTIVTTTASSPDPLYDGLDPDDVTVVNTDDETPGVTVSPLAGLLTTEGGGSATFDIVLNQQPSADVTIGLSSSDSGEGTVSLPSVTFTPANWDIPQTVTVTGVDDDIDDDLADYSIVTAPATSADAGYDALDAADVSVQNADDDTAGIVVAPVEGLETSEALGTAGFDIVLASQPTANVSIAFVSTDTTEGMVLETSVTFTPADWNQTQTITVDGVDDDIDDGVQFYSVRTLAAVSVDPKYNGLDPPDVEFSNADDDTAGVVVDPTSGLVTSEDGTEASFQVVLASEPTADVTIAVVSDDATEGNALTPNIVFNAQNWNVPQTVTIKGVDDTVADGDQSYSIVTTVSSEDGLYDAFAVDDVSVVNQDNDTAGILVSPTSGLQTTEGGGQATFEIVLHSEPVVGVVIVLTSSQPDEGDLSQTQLIFSPEDWQTPQSVTVTGVDDDVDDGDQVFTIVTSAAASADPNYDGLDPADVTVENLDDDTAGITVAPIADLTTTEQGGTAQFQIVLDSRPSGNVTIELSSSDAGEGTVSPTSVVFIPAQWDVPQTITVTGVDDLVVDADVVYTIATGAASSTDPAYDGLAVDDPQVTNVNDDTATLFVIGPSEPIVEGTDGTTTDVSVVLRLAGAVEGGFAAPYSTVDGTATVAGEDYIASSGAIQFDGTDDETHTIILRINHDGMVEPAESFRFELGDLLNLPDSVVDDIVLVDNPAFITITDDDSTTISIDDVTRNEGSDGSTTEFEFLVTLSNAVQGGFQLGYESVDGTATVADGDYAGNAGTIEFAGLALESKAIVIGVSGDTTVEPDELFGVALGGLSQLIDDSMSGRITVDAEDGIGTIENDDLATITFVTASSVAIEASASHQVDVVLSVTNGGTLGSAVVVNITDLGTGTADPVSDYELLTNTITFVAGSTDGQTGPVTLTLVADEVLNEDETINIALGLEGESIGGQVTLGEPAEHTIAITDDPSTASVSGYVWVDANNNGNRDQDESPLPGVPVTLRGQSLAGQPVEVATVTDSDGSYSFAALPGGTYEIVETQPAALYDGREALGTVGGAPTGQVGSDRFTGITLAPAQQAVDYSFGELGVKARYLTIHVTLASFEPVRYLRATMATAEELRGNTARAEAIRRGGVTEVRRIGSKVSVMGSDASDAMQFTPPSSSVGGGDRRHVLNVNGIQHAFLAAEVNEFQLDGGGGADELVLNDSGGADALDVRQETADLVGVDFQLEAVAFDLVRAISASGGDDTVRRQAIDFALELEGDWRSIGDDS